jgi:hypothetical protein
MSNRFLVSVALGVGVVLSGCASPTDVDDEAQPTETTSTEPTAQAGEENLGSKSDKWAIGYGGLGFGGLGFGGLGFGGLYGAGFAARSIGYGYGFGYPGFGLGYGGLGLGYAGLGYGYGLGLGIPAVAAVGVMPTTVVAAAPAEPPMEPPAAVP